MEKKAVRKATDAGAKAVRSQQPDGLVEVMTPPLSTVPDDVQTFSLGCAISCCSLWTKGFLLIQVIQ